MILARHPDLDGRLPGIEVRHLEVGRDPLAEPVGLVRDDPETDHVGQLVIHDVIPRVVVRGDEDARLPRRVPGVPCNPGELVRQIRPDLACIAKRDHEARRLRGGIVHHAQHDLAAALHLAHEILAARHRRVGPQREVLALHLGPYRATPARQQGDCRTTRHHPCARARHRPSSNHHGCA